MAVVTVAPESVVNKNAWNPRNHAIHVDVTALN